ncbi:MAG: class I SAM-dependent methyltransferase [Planctomycetes bacterium]|nr:class I SAM-dependent methyltransferase [Planctomycetota bacterium]
MDADALSAELGGMDIYLLDQILKGRFAAGLRLLDVGCGGGRNMIWFARNGFDVYGCDASEKSVNKVRELGIVPADHILHQSGAKLPWDDGHFQGVVCNALLHVLESRAEFDAVLNETWRVLAPGGVWFARLATTLSMEQHAEPLGDGRYRMPGTQWDILPTGLDEMLAYTGRLGGSLLEPIKTVNVQNQRAMATWVMRKQPGDQ